LERVSIGRENSRRQLRNKIIIRRDSIEGRMIVLIYRGILILLIKIYKPIWVLRVRTTTREAMEINRDVRNKMKTTSKP
jgi:hypothetical protein